MLAMGISHWLTQFKALFKKIHGFLCSITCICLGFHTDCTVLCKSNANDNRRIKRYIERYIIRAIVLFLGKISFPASDISFPLCDISFQLCDISFPLCDIHRFYSAIFRLCLKRYRSSLSSNHCEIHVHFPKDNS